MINILEARQGTCDLSNARGRILARLRVEGIFVDLRQKVRMDKEGPKMFRRLQSTEQLRLLLPIKGLRVAVCCFRWYRKELVIHFKRETCSESLATRRFIR